MIANEQANKRIERIVKKNQSTQNSIAEINMALQSDPNQVTKDKIALVVDRSFSMWGSKEKKRRPLAIGFAVHHFLSYDTVHFIDFI